MKIHTPLFIIGLITFVTPILGLPPLIETIVIAAYGITIMLLVSSIKFSKKEGSTKVQDDFEEEDEIEEDFNKIPEQSENEEKENKEYSQI